MTSMTCPKDFNGLSQEQLISFDKFISCNVGLNKGEIIEKFKDYKFTIESLEWLFYTISKNTCSFQGIGPFLEKDGKIYNIKKKKNDTIKALVEENRKLKEKIKKLEEMLAWREDLHKHQYV